MKITICAKCGDVIGVFYAPLNDEEVVCENCAIVFDVAITRQKLNCFGCGSDIMPTESMTQYKGTRQIQYWHTSCWEEHTAQPKRPEGQWVEIRWHDTKETEIVYVSFFVHIHGSPQDENTFFYMNAANCDIGYRNSDWEIVALHSEGGF
jgi:ribosomal protein S27E